ncbi:hypothetical protein BJ875DRAFT_264352 [Amylocarpus encephaloides]|uniref:Uncharacterized protein n=1 Tax=Amylocarpus encephaloides TaxID=45428 RepID=A0A9P8C834_9HELO|nr:hypothetical protein BJ875DRAFT_264352 [Amylocarpus encephaloides]
MPGAVATTSATAVVVTPALTTTFTPTATGCIKNQLTMLANREYQIWLNMPLPVPGTTMSECYPSQFMSSYLESAGGVTQAAFDPLVCPQSYSAVGPFTSNYIACCPSGYSLAPPKETVFSDRPAFGGTCYTPLTSGKAVQVTQYGSSGVTATSTFMPTVTNAQAYAYPYEGYAFGVQQVISIVSGESTTIAVASSTASSTAAAAAATSSAGSGATHTILAAAGPTFIPNSVDAKVGDKLIFQFSSGNHSLTQSTFDSPCTPLSNGFDSGYIGSSTAEIPLSVNVSAAQCEYLQSRISSIKIDMG